MSKAARPKEHECPGCDYPTLGHAVNDPSGMLCRDCFLSFIARGDGDTLEAQLLASEVAWDEASSVDIARKMRALHVEKASQS